MAKSYRRTKGDGSITKHGNRYLCRYWAKLPDGTKQRKSFYVNTRQEAAKELRRRTAARDSGKVIYNSKYTIESYYNEIWKPIIDRNLKITTVEVYERMFRLHILPYFGNKKLIALQKGDIKGLIDYLLEKTSARQCRIVKNALSPMLDYAVSNDIMGNNPFRKLEKSDMPTYEPKEREIWSLSDLKHFLKTVKWSTYYPIYMLLINYGMRRGEALGLRIKDIELRDGEKDSDGNEDWGEIRIRQQVVVAQNRPTITTPKTESSKRELPLTKQMHDLLKPYIDKRQDRNELLFHTSNGTPIAPRNLERDYYKMIEKSGLEHIPLHSLRHMTCTALVDAGVPVKTVQSILGHKDLNTTLKIYAHCNMEDKRSAMSSMFDIVSE